MWHFFASILSQRYEKEVIILDAVTLEKEERLDGDDADISLTIHFRKENWIQDENVWYRMDLFCVWNSDTRAVEPLNFWGLQSEIEMEAERYEGRYPEIVVNSK